MIRNYVIRKVSGFVCYWHVPGSGRFSLFVLQGVGTWKGGGRLQRGEHRTQRRKMQDLPPAAGYSPIQWKRNIPSRGFSPKVFLVIIGSMMGFGWYRAIQGIHERRELTREKMWSRIYLMPLLVAEEDRATVRRELADDAREKALMGDVQANYSDGSKGRGFHWM